MLTFSSEDSSLASSTREIPFNYTSADDRQAIAFLLGPDAVRLLDELRSSRVTGRSARRLMRILGDVLIHRRNPYLFQELIDSAQRKRRFFENTAKDLDALTTGANGDSRVLDMLAKCRELIARFRADVEGAPGLRSRIKRELGGIIGGSNVLFDPFSLVSHATDATDWRLHLPLAVVTPAVEAHVAPLLAAIAQLGLKAVPRGAGTGLTGGAVPLRSGCVVVNTEKLNRIRGIAERDFLLEDGRVARAQVMEVEAGVITESAMEHAAEQGLVFATDPTSAWACTIGGNIAENAGGKMAVRWGTCIDNLLEWRMAMPDGQRWTVRRTNHQLRKILPQDTVTFDVLDEEKVLRKADRAAGHRDPQERPLEGHHQQGSGRRAGTAKGRHRRRHHLGALLCSIPRTRPSGRSAWSFSAPDFDEASRVILELSRVFPFPADGQEALLALEHFDDEYIRAIGYKVKAARAQTPKAVLLIDIAGDSVGAGSRGAWSGFAPCLRSIPIPMLFVARDDAEAKRFWADRKKLGAIARRTNAFKMNEDIVLPLDALAEFAHFIDGINIEEERYSQIYFAQRAEEVLSAAVEGEDEEQSATQLPARVELCARFRRLLENLDVKALRSLTAMQEFRQDLESLMRGYPGVLSALERAHQEVRNRRIVLATHMHAGDGNVHVNIPVLSNDRAMLKRADRRIDKVMAKVVSLGGVVSGEHGIGVTKLKYLETERIDGACRLS